MTYQIIDKNTGKPLTANDFGDVVRLQYKFRSIAEAVATAINQVPGFDVKVVELKPVKKFRLSSKWGDDKKCEGCRTMEGSIFFDDGMCRCKIGKHHYHCGVCGRLIQIG